MVGMYGKSEWGAVVWPCTKEGRGAYTKWGLMESRSVYDCWQKVNPATSVNRGKTGFLILGLDGANNLCRSSLTLC